MEILRPFVPQTCGYDAELCDPDVGEMVLRIVRITADALSNIRRILQRHESLYAGCPIDINFAATITELAFGSLSMILTHGRSFVGAAGEGFWIALRMVRRMSRPYRVMHFALQGIKHSLAKEKLSVPPEVAEILSTAAPASSSADDKLPKASWTFDMRQKGTNLDDSRLESVIQEMNRLALVSTGRDDAVEESRAG